MPVPARQQTVSFKVVAGEDRSDRPQQMGPDINLVKVSAMDTEGRFALFEYIGNARGGPPLHVHPDQDEVFFIHDGSYVFQCGEQRTVMGPGDTIFLPRGVPHAFARTSPTGRLLFMFTPAGDMEAFFAEAALVEGQPSPDQAAALFASHGMTVVGPPLTID